MATEVTLPELGDGIESGDVLEIFVSVGDVISEGQDIVEMETDKATVPVPSSTAGKVTKINISEGDTVPIGGVLLEVEAESGASQAAPSSPEPEPEPKSEPEAKSEPESKQEPKAEPETKPEPAPQTPAARTQPPDPEPAPSQPATTQNPAAQPTTVSQPAVPAVATQGSVIPAGPAIRRFAREVGVDLGRVTGSGEGGRITREDVLAVVRSTSQSRTAPAPTSPATTANAPTQPAKPTGGDRAGAADVDDFGSIHVERMSKIRKTIARQMHSSWTNVPRVTNFDDADITDLETLRQASKEEYAASGLKLTTMPFLIKAVATALRHHPAINAVIDEANEQVIYKDYVNVGIAVDTERGLVVPVMRNADSMGVADLTRSLAEMAGKVRAGNFAVSDLKGGTFTISNLGAIGGQYSTPIVNVPEVAILLVGRSRKMPVLV